MKNCNKSNPYKSLLFCIKSISTLCMCLLFSQCLRKTQDNAQVFGQSSGDCSLKSLPNVLEYNNQTHQEALYQLTNCQRQQLIMNAEGLAITWPNRSRPGGREFASAPITQTLRALKVPVGEVGIKGAEWSVDHYEPIAQGLPSFTSIKEAAGIQTLNGFVQIPVHPTTQSYHPWVEKLVKKGYPVEDLKPVVATMSRSLWNPQNSNLWTIKMGSDYVHGRKAPNKLTDVGEDIEALANNTQKTSIPDWIATLDVGYLVDRAAVTVSDPGNQDKSLDYTIALRDYSPLLQDRYRIYMPQYLLFQLGRFKSQGPGSPRTFVVPYSFGKEITMGEDDIQSILDHLNGDMARVVAIHHANGYMPLDFHAQNVLVGIPLNREVKPRLVLRDVGDIYEFKFPESVRDRPNGWPGIKTITVESMVCYDSSRVQMAAYGDQMKKMKFPLPGGSWEDTSRLSLNSISYDFYQKNQKQFWSQVKAVRESGLARRCSIKTIAAKSAACKLRLTNRPLPLGAKPAFAP